MPAAIREPRRIHRTTVTSARPPLHSVVKSEVSILPLPFLPGDARLFEQPA